MNAPSASERVEQLINNYPHLFANNKETYIILGTALINHAQASTEYILSKLQPETDASNIGVDLSKIDESCD